MKEIPILMSTPMVQAILAGRKRKTRRVMKPQIEPCDHSIYIEADWKDQPTVWSGAALKYTGRAYCALCGNGTNPENKYEGIRSPYGKEGDILWVREGGWVDNNYCHGLNDPLLYWKADSERYDEDDKIFIKEHMSIFPGIHMYKSFARIWLEVISIKVERLQDITEEDAIAEGVEPNCSGPDNCPSPHCKSNGCQGNGEYFHYMHSFDDFPAFSAVESFESLWHKINGEQSYNDNPWVWVIEFKILSTTGKPKL